MVRHILLSLLTTPQIDILYAAASSVQSQSSCDETADVALADAIVELITEEPCTLQDDKDASCVGITGCEAEPPGASHNSQASQLINVVYQDKQDAGLPIPVCEPAAIIATVVHANGYANIPLTIYPRGSFHCLMDSLIACVGYSPAPIQLELYVPGIPLLPSSSSDKN